MGTARLKPDLGREAGQVDVEIRQLGGLAGKMLHRAVAAFDERG